MKLSQFKKIDNKKKLTFYANGTSEITTPERHIVGEVNFVEISGDMLDLLIETFASEENQNNEIQLIYTLIPLISDIEMDITLEEFVELYDNPSTEFMQLATVIMESINEIANKFAIYKRILEETNKADEMKELIDSSDKEDVEISDVPLSIVSDGKISANVITADMITDGVITSNKIMDSGTPIDKFASAKRADSDFLDESSSLEPVNIYEALDISELQEMLRETTDKKVRLEIVKQMSRIVNNQ